MELNDYLRLLRKKWYIVVIVTAICAALGSIYSLYFVEPVYESSIPVIIGSVQQQKSGSAQNSNTQSYNDIMMYQKLVKTYCEFVKTRIVVEDAINNSGIKTTYEDAIDMISAVAQNDTEFLKISVKSPNKFEAALLANALAKSLKEISADVKNIDNVQLVDEASVPTSPINKSPLIYIMISFAMGIVLSVGLIILLDILDNTVKDSEGIEKQMNVSVIGSIPFAKIKKEANNDDCSLSDEIITHYKPLSLVSENYKALRTNIQFSMIDKTSCTISVTSCAPSEGKSTVISNTSVVVAQSGKKVLLIDCDLRKPVIHRKFGLPNKKGLTNYLLGECELGDVIQKTAVENLSVMTSGKIPPNPSEILTSQKYIKLIEELKTQYDYIFIDAPPVLIVTDAQIISSMVDGMLLVAEFGSTEKAVLEKAKECLDRANAKCLGVIINQIPKKEIGYYGYGKYGKKYGYKYGNGYYIND